MISIIHFILFHFIDFEPTTTENEEHAAGAGRKSNARYNFASSHPLAETHEQQLRSKPSIPFPVGVPPKPPGKRCKKLTEAWKNQARKFAKYILILFRPWNDESGQLPGDLSWRSMCVFLRQLREGSDGSGQTLLGRIREAWVKNVARGMRMPAAPRVAASQYRKRKATIWTRPDGTAPLGTKRRKLEVGAGFFDDDDDNVDCNPKNDRSFQPDDPQTLIDMMRLEAAADDQMNARQSKEAAYHAATLATLDGIMNNNETPSLPLDTNQMQGCIPRLLFSPMADRPSFESIIDELKTDPDLPGNICVLPLEPNTTPYEIGIIPAYPVNISSSENLLYEEQMGMWKSFDDFFIEKRSFLSGCEPEPTAPWRFLSGGPGTGKTFLLNCIKSSAENHGFSIAATAFTGGAVKGLPKGVSRTMHTTFGFKIKQSKIQVNSDYQQGANDQQLIRLRSHFDLKTLVAFLIDEISYISSENLGRIEKRLREIMAKDEPFGGLAVIISGDMFQFPPVDGTAIYVSICVMYLHNRKLLCRRNCRYSVFHQV